MLPKGYAVLKGRPIAVRHGTTANPHYQIHVVDDESDHRIAVNVQSADGSEVEYAVYSRLDHPMLPRLRELPAGFQRIEPGPGGIALDYIRGNLLQPWELVPLPPAAPGPDNDLNEKLDAYVQRALADEEAMVYAFGEPWGPEHDKSDKYFGFRPGRGIHDIHMNQGNPPPPRGKRPWFEANGPWQDGGLIIEFPRQRQWVAIFLKFRSQAWHTDDATGHPLELGGGGPPADGDPPPIGPPHPPTEDLPDGLIRIVAALVNDAASPERETVTLLNTTDRGIDLAGWRLADKMKHKMDLSGTLARGATVTVEVRKPVELSNRGGIITLLDPRGVKVHGVSYTRDQARTPGWTIAF